MNIRTWRKSKGITGRKFADMCGVAYSTMIAYERGARRPRRDVAQRIEAATNGDITAAGLLGITGPSTLREDPASFSPESTVTIPIPERLLVRANEQELDVAALIAGGGIDKLKQALRQSFNQRNRSAIEANRKHIEAHGTFAERMGIWQGR